MKISFKLDRKVFWISLLTLVLIALIIYITQRLYGTFSSKDVPTSATLSSPQQSVAKPTADKLDLSSVNQSDAGPGDSVDNSAHSIEGEGQGTQAQDPHPTKGNQDPVDLSDDESQIELKKNSFVTELKKIRDPFQKLIDQEGQESPGESSKRKAEEIVSTLLAQPSVTGQIKDQYDFNTDTMYEELYQQVSRQRTVLEEEPVEIGKPLEYPAFLLKGIVAQGERKKAILTIDQQSFIVTAGEEIQGWFIQEINESELYLENQEGQRFILTLEGVKVLESTE